MKKEECDIVKDLLPSYCDKITSTATNQLVESHIKTCEECKNELQNMKKEIEQPIIEEKEKIDYLKGYRKSKIKAVLIAIIIMLLAFEIFVATITIITNIEFFVDIKDINITYEGKSMDEKTGKEKIKFIMNNEKYVIFEQEKREDMQNKALYIKVIGKYERTYDYFILFCNTRRKHRKSVYGRQKGKRKRNME